MESLEAEIDEVLQDFFEEFFPTYDMKTHAIALVKWLESAHLRIVEDDRT